MDSYAPMIISREVPRWLKTPRILMLIWFSLLGLLVLAILYFDPGHASFLWLLVLIWFVLSFVGFMVWIVVAYGRHLAAIPDDPDEPEV